MTDECDHGNRFEKLGKEEVRHFLEAHRFSAPDEILAIKWLAQKDREFERRNESSQSEQIDIARSAKDAAWAAAKAAERAAAAAENANTRATIALAIAIISIMTTIVGIWFVHKDSTKISSQQDAQVALALDSYSTQAIK